MGTGTRVVRRAAWVLLAPVVAGIGLAPAVAAAATSEATSVVLNAFTSPVVAYGSEGQTFTGTVTGKTGDGYPTSGAVDVLTQNGTPVCDGTLTAGSGDQAQFTCTSSATALPAGTYTVHAHYAGGASSNTTFTYGTSNSTTRQLRVTTPETSTISLNAITSPVAHGFEAQTFTGTVTGVTNDGYPTGTVTVRTSTGTVLCTVSLAGGSGSTASYSCNASTPTKLPPTGTAYTVHARYQGGTSSNPSYSYTASTSATRSLTVVTPASVTPTVTLNTPTTPVTHGFEAQTFTGTVKGVSADGYPKTGAVLVETSTNVVLCTGSLTVPGSSGVTHFKCDLTTGSKLADGTYTLRAHYTGGASSDANYKYTAATSATRTLVVTSGVATTSTLTLSAASRVVGTETGEVFTVKVTGKSGDGYPKGTVKVKTTGGTALCTTSTSTSHTTDSATFACSPRASALTAGHYTVVATFTPGTPSSSTTAFAYAASTSASASFTVASSGATRIYGSTTDATAAQELESVYPGARGSCPGTTSNRPVVLATDEHFPDALSASYLEKWLGTGLLLTPTSSLSSVTLIALRTEGITHVYVVGGPLAVATSVLTQLRGTYVYQCGGTTRTSSHLGVTRIYGQTQYTTAEDIAKTPGSTFAASEDLQGAYGLYNDTSGKSSGSPGAGSYRTAILASGAEFQDAEAAATLAYANDLPLLLTTPTSLSPAALAAMTTLGITQVVLMGGPLAVSNAVVTALVSHRISVLRVAGTDATDTAVQLADVELASSSGHLGFGWTPTGGVTITVGSFYTDGLAGAVVSAHGGVTGGGPQPMLLTENPTTAGSHLTAFLQEAGTRGIDGDGTLVSSLTVLGGPLAVSTALVTSMEGDL